MNIENYQKDVIDNLKIYKICDNASHTDAIKMLITECNNYFDCVISLVTIHNLNKNDCAKSLTEIERVSEGKSYITVDAYSNLEEKKFAGVVKEDSFRNPKTMYGCNKLYCEHLGAYYTNHYQRLGAIEQQSCIDFRSIRFPGIISSKTIPTAGTSDYIPEMLHAAAKGEPYNCFVRENTKIPFMTMPDAINAIIQMMKVSKEKLTRTVYNIRSFALTAEEFRQKLMEFFPDAEIRYSINEKRQKMVDSWPADTDDSFAQNEWGWNPNHNLDNGLSEYLIPDLTKLYNN